MNPVGEGGGVLPSNRLIGDVLLNQVAFSLELLEWEGTFSGFGGSENSGREGFKNGNRNGNIIFYQTSNTHLEKRD